MPLRRSHDVSPISSVGLICTFSPWDRWHLQPPVRSSCSFLSVGPTASPLTGGFDLHFFLPPGSTTPRLEASRSLGACPDRPPESSLDLTHSGMGTQLSTCRGGAIAHNPYGRSPHCPWRDHPAAGPRHEVAGRAATQAAPSSRNRIAKLMEATPFQHKHAPDPHTSCVSPRTRA